MELSSKQQIVGLLQTAQKILLLTHQEPDGDGIGALLSLYLALKKMGKTVMAVCPALLPTSFHFLPAISHIQKDLEIGKDFAILLDTAGAEIEKVGYQRLKDQLKIIVSTRGGRLDSANLKVEKQPFSTDAIFILDCPDWTRLGNLFEENSDLFYEVPTVNIDHHASNSHFARINWVDLTASSTCEILVSLLESLGREKNLVDEDIATCLLLGLLTDTSSFKNQNTTPKSLTVAAQLLAGGGRKEEIIGNLWQTKTVSILKLWGKILQTVALDSGQKFLWAKAGQSLFKQTGVNPEDIKSVLDELLKTAAGVDFVLFLIEKEEGVAGELRATHKGVDVLTLAQLFGGGGHLAAAGFLLPNLTLEEAESQILEKIRRQLALTSANGKKVNS